MSKPVFTRSAFIEFLETKNPNEEYPYSDMDECACSKYAQSLGMTWSAAKNSSAEFQVLDEFASRAYPRTYGTLLHDLKTVNDENYAKIVNEAKVMCEWGYW